MFPRNVSPRTVFLLALPLAFVLYLPLMPLEDALIRQLDFLPRPRPAVLLLLLVLLSHYFLVPVALLALGIQVRGRSVERLRAVDRGKGGEASIDLPICIRYSRWLIWYLSASACFVGVLFLAFASSPPPDRLTVPARVLGVSLLIAGLILTVVRGPTLCEINEEGIRAPEGSFRLTTFVPWKEFTDCEIIHDDRSGSCDYFVLRDRSGRRRFRESGAWMGQMRSADRARVLRALRFRFPQKAKSDRAPEPSIAGPSASGVWDRELDG